MNTTFSNQMAMTSRTEKIPVPTVQNHSVALQTIENEKRRASNARNGTSVGSGAILPPAARGAPRSPRAAPACFDWTQFEQWMRATCEGSDQVRGTMDEDSSTDEDSDDD